MSSLCGRGLLWRAARTSSIHSYRIPFVRPSFRLSSPHLTPLLSFSRFYCAAPPTTTSPPPTTTTTTTTAPETRASTVTSVLLVPKPDGRVEEFHIIAKETGTWGTDDFRIYFYDKDNKQISPWKDIPLFLFQSSGKEDAASLTETTETTSTLHENWNVFPYVVEIPKGTDEKMEMDKDFEFNPIVQDKKKDRSLRYIKHGKLPFNYGFLPQTWESPFENVETEQGEFLIGDGDPLDVVDLTSSTLLRGSVHPIKILGALALIDQGELDFKLIGLSTQDPAYEKVNNLKDAESVFPKALETIREWFRVYKVVEGKEVNRYAFGGKMMKAEDAIAAIKRAHESWKASDYNKPASKEGSSMPSDASKSE